MSTDARAIIAVQTAANLIAAGGAYQHARLTDVVAEVIDEIHSVEAHFKHMDGDCECPACSAPTKSEMN